MKARSRPSGEKRRKRGPWKRGISIPLGRLPDTIWPDRIGKGPSGAARRNRKLALLAAVLSGLGFFFLLRIRVWWLALGFGWIVYKLVRNMLTGASRAAAPPPRPAPAPQEAEPAPQAAAKPAPAPAKPRPEPVSPLRIILSAVAGAATVGIAHALADYSILTSFAAGAAVCVGFIMAFGRPFPPADGVEEARARKAETEKFTSGQRQAIAEAERQIAEIEMANADIRNTEFSDRLDRIATAARRILEVLKAKPDMLGRARKFLEVYLTGARQVIEKYAETHRFASSEELESRFRRLLETIETSFEEQRTALLADDVLELDVAIQVLEAQLRQEGIA